MDLNMSGSVTSQALAPPPRQRSQGNQAEGRSKGSTGNQEQEVCAPTHFRAGKQDPKPHKSKSFHCSKLETNPLENQLQGKNEQIYT